MKNRYDVYLASPFFTPEQVEREEFAKVFLRELGLSVFSPKDNCFLSNNASIEDRKRVFDDNVMAIRGCNAVFAITDGKDMGTIWEAGYAYGINVPIIYFAETLGDNPFNLMLAQSGVITITNRKMLKEQLTLNLFNTLVEIWKIDKTQLFDFEGIIE